MRERVGTERLDELGHERQSAGFALRRPDMLGTNAERNLHSGLFGPRVDRHAHSVELDAARVEFADGA